LIRSLSNIANWKFWLSFHILLGLLTYVTKWALVGWLYLFILLSLWEILRNRKSFIVLVGFSLAYITGIELLCRIAKTSPYIPYEFGKYYFVLIVGIFILVKGELKMNIGIIIMILCLPALFFIPEEGYRTYLVNSFSGIFLTGMLAYIFSSRKIYIHELKSLFVLMLYGIIVITISIIVGSPDIDQIEFDLVANSQTTANFGSNQVSTLLGLGILITGISLLLKLRLFNPRLITLSFFILFAIRGLLTFSRGGILGGAISLMVFYFMPNVSKLKPQKINIFLFLFIVTVLVGSFFYVNSLTNNVLVDRYKGETPGTKLGYREVTLETITSRRSSLIFAEWGIFLENPIFGVGPGAGYAAREEKIGMRIASHTEVTRLLAEHGLFGLVIALIFLLYPVYKVSKTEYGFDRLLSAAFFSFAVFTSMHAAMRTTVTPFLWGLGCATFIGQAPLFKMKKTQNRQ